LRQGSDADRDARLAALEAEVASLRAANAALAASLAALPRALRSVATALHEAASGGPVRAMVAASPEDVHAWLARAHLEAQYGHALAPLGGAGLLLQTEASLLAAGVLAPHVPLLLERISAAACAPPCTQEEEEEEEEAQE
jgi:hypothetical protein